MISRVLTTREVDLVGVDLVEIDFVRVDLVRLTHLQGRSALDKYKDTYNALARYSERGLQLSSHNTDSHNTTRAGEEAARQPGQLNFLAL